MGRVWRAASGSARRQAAALWCVQLGVNGFWPVVFFLWQEHGAAFFLLAGLIALVLAMSAQFPAAIRRQRGCAHRTSCGCCSRRI